MPFWSPPGPPALVRTAIAACAELLADGVEALARGALAFLDVGSLTLPEHHATRDQPANEERAARQVAAEHLR